MEWAREALDWVVGWIVAAIASAFAALFAIIAYFEKRERARIDRRLVDLGSLEQKVGNLERDMVSQAASIERALEMHAETIQRVDIMHATNSASLKDITERLARGSVTRHHINSVLQALVNNLSVTNKMLGKLTGIDLPDIRLPDIRHED